MWFQIVPGRMGMLVTLFLSLTALLVSTISSSPEVKYLNETEKILWWCLKSVMMWFKTNGCVFVSGGKYAELITLITQVSQGISALTCWVLVHFFFIFGAIVVYGSQLVILRSGYLFTSYIPFKMLLQRFCLGRYGTNAGNLVLDLCYL